MKIILTKDVSGLGRAGDVKDVSDGHARNFLIPKHLGLPATSEALIRIQKEESERQAKVRKNQEKFLDLKKNLENKTFTVKAKANKKNLFAAVHEAEIAKAITDKSGAEISPEMIRIKLPVKALGIHEIEVRFAPNLIALVKLNIESLE
ncbi:MAG TPA: 50S ribosomal protein L9 [Patescibacteria group bacterium]